MELGLKSRYACATSILLMEASGNRACSYQISELKIVEGSGCTSLFTPKFGIKVRRKKTTKKATFLLQSRIKQSIRYFYCMTKTAKGYSSERSLGGKEMISNTTQITATG